MMYSKNITLDLLKKLVDEIPYAILVAQPNGEFNFWNKEAYRLFNKDLRQSPQAHWVDDWGCYKLDGTKYQTEDIPLSMALRGINVYNEKMCLKMGGAKECMYIKISAFPLTDDNGDVVSAVVMCEDITKEQELYEHVIERFNEIETYIKDLLDVKTIYNYEKQNLNILKEKLAKVNIGSNSRLINGVTTTTVQPEQDS